MTTELTAIRKKLEKKLKEERYIHTLGVMYTAASMAMRHGADVQKAMTAGLLHDCGKYCDVNEQIRLCRKHHIILSEKIPGLAEVRTAAFDDIDTAVCMTAESTLAFLKRAGRKVDPMTEKTCQYYKNKAATSL